MRGRMGGFGLPVLVIATVVSMTMLGGAALAGESFMDRMDASLSGANEVPPADPDGTGFARLRFFTSGGGADAEICWRIRVQDIALPATAAHIHEGEAGVNGDIVVFLSAPDANGVAQGCTTDFAPETFVAIGINPAGYYVNVHNAEFPGGAVRGQLSN